MPYPIASYSAPRPQKRRLVTLWSVLALLSAIVGAAGTITAGQLSIRRWAFSGTRMPISQTGMAELPAGLTHIYYETLGDVPDENLSIRIVDETGRHFFADRLRNEDGFKLLFGNLSGRAIWTLDAPAAGKYWLTCYNNNYEYENEVPTTDRLTVNKKPGTLAEAASTRKIIQISGATVTALLVIGFYIMHGITLNRRS